MNTFLSATRKVAAGSAIISLLFAATLSFVSLGTFAQAAPTAVITAVTPGPYTVNNTITVDGLSSLDSTGSTGGSLLYNWVLSSVPTGSTASLSPNASSATVNFNPDLTGSYTIDLVVIEGATVSTPVSRSFTVVNPPTAVITTTTASPFVVGNAITANGLNSLDGNGATGGTFVYNWALTTVPTGSTATLSPNNSSATVTFTPDVIGSYVLGLTVIENGLPSTLPATQGYNVVAAGGGGTPTAIINIQTAGPYVVNNTITVDGLNSLDINGATGGSLAYNWTLSTVPTGSTATLSPNASAATVSFNPTVAGQYTIDLVVTEGTVQSPQVSQGFTVVTSGGGGGGGSTGGVPYSMQGGGRCVNPAYCNVPWSATDNQVLRKRDGVTGITLEKKVNGRKADTEETAAAVGRRTTTDVNYEVVISNFTGYNIDTIRLQDVFTGNREVRMSNIRSVRGAKYNPSAREFTIDTTIQHGATRTFSYNATLTSRSTNATANNTMVVKDVVFPAGVYERSADAKNGLSDAAYVKFGQGSSTGVTFGTSAVNLNVPTNIVADKSEVKAGEEITYTITVRNNSDDTLTGVVVSDNYDESLVSVSSANGGDDNGTDVSWAVGRVEPGEAKDYTYTAVVREDAAYADTLLVDNVRVYTDQYDEQATASVDVHIAPKFAGFLAGASRTLPQTGAITLVPLLGSLGLAFATRKRKRL
jgi:uncharacterized repeat protein (TIGR01451 family)